MTDERDSTQATLRFVRYRGETYIAVEDAVATLREILPSGTAYVDFIESVELEWWRTAEKALSK